MTKAKGTPSLIQIRMKGGSGTLIFNPGDVVSGGVEIFPQEAITCRNVSISCGWRTEGKGNTNRRAIWSNTFDVTLITENNPFMEQFEFTIPDEPWSYAGHFINIIWSIEVKIDIAMGRDINQEQRFVVQPS